MTRSARRGRKTLSLVALTLVTALVGPACNTQQAGPTTTFIPMLDLDPPGFDMEVGQSTSLSVSLDGAPVPSDRPTWASDDPQVATVDAMGNVTCVGVGTTTIRAAVAPRAGAARVTCVAPTLIQLGETQLEHVHTIGDSPCPDTVGEFSITNTTEGPIVVMLEPGHPALRTSVGRVELEAGETITVTVSFDCSVRSPGKLSTEVVITATDEQLRAQTASLPVALTIREQ